MVTQAEGPEMRADDLARLFVDHVYLPAISATVGNLEAPPGRTPATDLRKASEWFASLNQQDRDMGSASHIGSNAAGPEGFGARFAMGRQDRKSVV